MNLHKRIYCPYCGEQLRKKPQGEVLRDYCDHCDHFFYDNPLPVVSSIVDKDRSILLVKRKYEPNQGEWCLPMGFAETGESNEAAALRELEEEAGIMGKVVDLVDVASGFSKIYGDLLFITYETEWVGGKPKAGDDAEEVSFFPFDKMPGLAFSSNTKAVTAYLRSKEDYWAIVDSFSQSIKITGAKGGDYLSDKLLRIVEKNAEVIGRQWMADIQSNKSTPTYSKKDPGVTMDRVQVVIAQFSKWLGGEFGDNDVRKYYHELGKQRKREGFALSEVLSALSLIRKHIWEFAVSHQVWTKTRDIYASLELERRMVLFFDRAAFYIARGYELK